MACNLDYYNDMKKLATDGKLDDILGEVEHTGHRPS